MRLVSYHTLHHDYCFAPLFQLLGVTLWRRRGPSMGQTFFDLIGGQVALLRRLTHGGLLLNTQLGIAGRSRGRSSSSSLGRRPGSYGRDRMSLVMMLGRRPRRGRPRRGLCLYDRVSCFLGHYTAVGQHLGLNGTT